MPLRVRGGEPSVTDDPRAFFAPYAGLLAGHFDALRAPEADETQEQYLDAHIRKIGQLCAWPARAELHEHQTLAEGSEENCYSDLKVEPRAQRTQVLIVEDDSTNVVNACDVMDTLNAWNPHLGGSVIAAFQRAVRSVHVWGPNETLGTMFCWGDEAQFWEDVRLEAWQDLHPDVKPTSLPHRKGRPVIPLTGDELRAYVRREKLPTPGQVRRRLGRATCRAARFPMTDEQLRGAATHPSTSDVQRAALTRFMDSLDEVRACEAKLRTWDDDEIFRLLTEQDMYLHAQFVIDTDPAHHSAVLEGYEDYERYQMHAGSSPYPSFVASLDVTRDLEEILLALGQLHETLVSVCLQLRDWPPGGVTPEMRAALRDLIPLGPEMYSNLH